MLDQVLDAAWQLGSSQQNSQIVTIYIIGHLNVHTVSRERHQQKTAANILHLDSMYAILDKQPRSVDFKQIKPQILATKESKNNTILSFVVSMVQQANSSRPLALTVSGSLLIVTTRNHMFAKDTKIQNLLSPSSIGLTRKKSSKGHIHPNSTLQCTLTNQHLHCRFCVVSALLSKKTPARMRTTPSAKLYTRSNLHL